MPLTCSRDSNAIVWELSLVIGTQGNVLTWTRIGSGVTFTCSLPCRVLGAPSSLGTAPVLLNGHKKTTLTLSSCVSKNLFGVRI